MDSQLAETENLLSLDKITLQDPPNRKYRLKLIVGGREIDLQQKENHTWAPTPRPHVSPTCEIKVEIEIEIDHFFGSLEYRKTDNVIDLEGRFDDPDKTEFTVPGNVTVGKRPRRLELRFFRSANVKSMRELLKTFGKLLKKHPPLMSGEDERTLDRAFEVGTAIASLNPIANAVFSLANVGLKLIKEQNKGGQVLVGLSKQLERILDLADKEVYEETEKLGKLIRRMFEVMDRVARSSCDYVEHGTIDLKKIEEMEKELTHVISDFQSVVTDDTNDHFKVKAQLSRLKVVETGYDLTLCCMKDTRKLVLDKIITWATNGPSQNNESNTYWIYGSPGIGKTALAHSISHSLHDQRQLIGAFFCQRDHERLSQTRNILPTLIYQLATMVPAFRRIVAKCLGDDHILSPGSIDQSFLLKLFKLFTRPPKPTLAFVVDALDECGDNRSQKYILEALTGVAAQVPWLRIIITSRPESGIKRFFDNRAHLSELRCDLDADQDASDDLQKFARKEFNQLAEDKHLSTPWPEPRLFNRVIAHADRLFIFITTIVFVLKKSIEPTEDLEAILQSPAGASSNYLCGLYTNILQRISPKGGIFQRVIGVLLVSAPYRSLCKDTIAALAGVKLNLVKEWMDDLTPLFYEDEGPNKGIRVRHLSIFDFFISDKCPSNYHVDPRNANIQLGTSCLTTMIDRLRFNICKLKDSRRANTGVQDLQSRIDQNIPDALQYSCLYWSNHLCSSPENDDEHGREQLKKFIEGCYPLFWIEVLSLLGMVSIGSPSLRRVLRTRVKGTDSKLYERIEDIRRFITTFQFPISMSAPHAYISTRPFLPSLSPLMTVFGKSFGNAIKMESGQLLSWPAPPSEWLKHTDHVNCTSYSPNGCYIATGSDDKTIIIWDADTGAAVGKPLAAHTKSVCCVAYSPDGRHITSGSRDNTVRVWDAETRVMVGEPFTGHTSMVNSVAYSPDGQHIISGSNDMTIRIWDAKTGDAIGKPLIGHRGWVSSVAYSPDGRQIISGSGNGKIKIWDVKTCDAVCDPLGHSSWVSSVAYSPDGCHIISGSYDNTIKIWDANTGVAVGQPLRGHRGWVNSITYSPNGHHIISGSHDKTIRIWDAKTGAPVGNPLKGHQGQVTSVAHCPNWPYIISGSTDKTVRIWNAETGAVVGKSLEWHSSRVSSVAYSPDGRQIITGSADMTIRIWDAETGAAIRKPLEGHTDSVESVAYSPAGCHITSGSSDKTVRVWNVETGVMVGRPLEGHKGRVNSVAYSPDGRRIVSGSNDRTIRIWDAETGIVVGKPLVGHKHWVISVAYSPDGHQIVSRDYSKMFLTWDTETGAEVLKGYTEQENYFAYSPDGQHQACTIEIEIARSDNNRIRPIMDAETHDEVDFFLMQYLSISGRRGSTIRISDLESGSDIDDSFEVLDSKITSVAYSPDGRHIVSGSTDKMIRIWDTKTGAVIREPLKGHTDSVNSVAYSPDGYHITSGSADKTVRVWDVKIGVAVGKPLEGHTRSVCCVAYSPNGRHIVSGSDDMTIRIWDAETGASVGKPLVGLMGWWVRSVAYSPDGRQIISRDNTKMFLTWDAETGAQVGKLLQGFTWKLNSVAYSPNGKRFISGSTSGEIQIWDAKSGLAIGDQFETLSSEIMSVAYSPDGRYVISGSVDKTIRLWDANTGVAVGKPLEGHRDRVDTVAYSLQDGLRIISRSIDNTIRIWNPRTSDLIQKPLIEHTAHVQPVTRPPNPQQIVAVSCHDTSHESETFLSLSIPLSLYDTTLAALMASPDPEGWVKDTNGDLLYWVPPDSRDGLHSPALLTLPRDSKIRSVSLNFDDFAFGEKWADIFKGSPP